MKIYTEKQLKNKSKNDLAMMIIKMGRYVQTDWSIWMRLPKSEAILHILYMYEHPEMIKNDE